MTFKLYSESQTQDFFASDCLQMNTKTTSPTPAEILGDAQLSRLEFYLLYVNLLLVYFVYNSDQKGRNLVLKQRQAVISALMGQLSSAVMGKLSSAL